MCIKRHSLFLLSDSCLILSPMKTTMLGIFPLSIHTYIAFTPSWPNAALKRSLATPPLRLRSYLSEEYFGRLRRQGAYGEMRIGHQQKGCMCNLIRRPACWSLV